MSPRSVRGAASEVATRLPEVATTTRSLIEDANREMQAGSDELLVVGSALTFGVAGGLLIGGGHRLLVAATLIPAAMMVLTVLDRSSRGRAGRRGAARQLKVDMAAGDGPAATPLAVR